MFKKTGKKSAKETCGSAICISKSCSNLLSWTAQRQSCLPLVTERPKYGKYSAKWESRGLSPLDCFRRCPTDGVCCPGAWARLDIPPPAPRGGGECQEDVRGAASAAEAEQRGVTAVTVGLRPAYTARAWSRSFHAGKSCGMRLAFCAHRGWGGGGTRWKWTRPQPLS